MNDSSLTSQHILRGLQLKQLGRYPDAESAFKEALAQNPEDAFALHHLAVCQFHQPDRQAEALSVVRRAIAAEPEEADHFALESMILSALNRAKEALSAARRAIELDPYSSFAFTAEAQAGLQLEQWREAEMSARQALAVDADNSFAANQLAHALRLQNKAVENAEHLAGMLARDPEDAFTHANAGWASLQRGDHRTAETHFREALRLDPEFDYAREGLLNSFRARSAFYRAYLRYCFWMQRMSANSRWAVVIGLYLGFRFSRSLFTGPYKPVGIAIGVLYFVFVLWVWVAKGFGNFLLLLDPFARHALRRNEKTEAVAVGGGVTLGALFLAAGLLFGADIFLLIGSGLIASSVPLSLTFTNDSPAGRWIFGAVGVGMLAATLLSAVAIAVPHWFSGSLVVTAFIFALAACAACTWLGNIPALRK